MRLLCSALDVHGDQLFMDQRAAGRCPILPSALCMIAHFAHQGMWYPTECVELPLLHALDVCGQSNLALFSISMALQLIHTCVHGLDWFSWWVAWLVDKDTDLISCPDVMQRLETPSCSMVWSKSLIPGFLVGMHGFPLSATSIWFLI